MGHERTRERHVSQLAEGQAWAGDAGDAAGEHLSMARGDYDAWFYVVLAFVLQMVVATVVLGTAFEWLGNAVSAKLAGWGS